MNEREMIQKSFSCLHASDETLREVYEMAEKKKSGVRRYGVLAVAVCLVLALGTGVLARTGGTFRPEEPADRAAFYRNAYGDEGCGEIIGDYVRDIDSGFTHGDYKLTVRNFVIDENGTGCLSWELENPNGIGLNELANPTEYTNPPVQLLLKDDEGNFMDERGFAVEDTFSETGAQYIMYFTPFTAFDGGDLTLVIRWWEDGEATDDEQKLPADTPVPGRELDMDGFIAKISPLGMTVSDIIDGPGAIRIALTDGGSYTVVDENGQSFIVGALKDGGGASFAFDRVIDVDTIVSGSVEPSEP